MHHDKKLSGRDQLKVRNNKAVTITEELSIYIKDHLVDMLVYGTDTATDRCNIFETLVPEWKYPKLQK